MEHVMTSLQNAYRITWVAALTICFCSDMTSAQSPEDPLLLSLKQQRMTLLNRFGPEHPSVEKVEKQIAEAEKAPAILLSLKQRRMTLLDSYGPELPSVGKVEKQIAETEKVLAVSAKPDLKRTSDAELRAEIIRLRTTIQELADENERLRGKLANPVLRHK